MKTKILLAVLASVFFLAACEKDYFQEENNLISDAKSAVIGEGTIVSEMIYVKALEGNLLGDPTERMIRVYLPKSYYECPEKRFPVIYFLHGTPAWGGMLTDPVPYEYFYQMAQLQAPVDFPSEGLLYWINNLIDNEGMEEAIIVMPDAKTYYGVNLYLNSNVLGNYEDYIVNDLVLYIDAKFRTIPHFNWRAITGHCAGAYGAFNAAMKHPKVFRYLGALTPPHFPEQTVLAIAGFIAVEDELWQDNWGVPPGPIPYDPYQPFKFANNAAYALAQAWLPNPDNPPYYCDLPLIPVDGQLVINPELMEKWNNQNLLSVVQQNRLGLKQLKKIYFDCGTNDDLGMYLPNIMLHEQLDAMNIKNQFETYSNPGTHISNLYERLGKTWVMISKAFPEYNE